MERKAKNRGISYLKKHMTEKGLDFKIYKELLGIHEEKKIQ